MIKFDFDIHEIKHFGMGSPWGWQQECWQFLWGLIISFLKIKRKHAI